MAWIRDHSRVTLHEAASPRGLAPASAAHSLVLSITRSSLGSKYPLAQLD